MYYVFLFQKDKKNEVGGCSASSCLNNGSCLPEEESYTCTCVPGFTGSNCEINIDDCDGVTCFNDGTCVDGVDSHTCICAPGFTGQTCEGNHSKM